jgi:hypothetical protein
VFNLSHTTAGKYTLIACDLLADQPIEAAEEQHYVPSEPGEIPELSGVEAVTGAELAARATMFGRSVPTDGAAAGEPDTPTRTGRWRRCYT